MQWNSEKYLFLLNKTKGNTPVLSRTGHWKFQLKGWISDFAWAGIHSGTKPRTQCRLRRKSWASGDTNEYTSIRDVASIHNAWRGAMSSRNFEAARHALRPSPTARHAFHRTFGRRKKKKTPQSRLQDSGSGLSLSIVRA